MVRDDNIVKYPTFSSFFFSFFIYLIFLSVLFFKFTQYKEEAKKYTDTIDSFIDVIVIDAPIHSNTPQISDPKEEKELEKEVSKVEEISQDIKEKTTTQEIKPNNETKKEPSPSLDIKTQPNINDLFKSIDISKINKKLEATNELKVQSRKKSDKETTNSKKSANNIIKDLKIDEISSSPKKQSVGIYDPFYGAINTILEQHWRAYRAQTDNLAQVQIHIDKYGKFSYNILQLSPDSEFNQKVKKFLKDMENITFPPAPANKNGVYNLELKDKITME